MDAIRNSIINFVETKFKKKLNIGFNFLELNLEKIDEDKYNIFNGMVENIFLESKILTRKSKIQNLYSFKKDKRDFFIFNIDYTYQVPAYNQYIDDEIVLFVRFVFMFDSLYNIEYFDVFPLFNTGDSNYDINGLSPYQEFLKKTGNVKKENVFGKCFAKLDRKYTDEEFFKIFKLVNLNYRDNPVNEEDCLRKGFIWDTPAFNDSECYFGKQYLGYCLVPEGVERIGFKKYNVNTMNNAVCKGCDYGKDGKCCYLQLNPNYILKF